MGIHFTYHFTQGLNQITRSSRLEVICKKGILRNFAKLKEVTLAQVFSCEFCEVFKNSFFYRRPLGNCFW